MTKKRLPKVEIYRTQTFPGMFLSGEGVERVERLVALLDQAPPIIADSAQDAFHWFERYQDWYSKRGKMLKGLEHD